MLGKLESFYQTQIEPYLHDRVLVVCTAIVLLIVLLGFCALRRRRGSIRVFKTTSGRVEVTRSAIRDLVLNACHYVHTPRKPKVRIKAGRGRLYIYIGLRLNEDQRLNEVASQLQMRIEDILQNTLNLDRRSVRIDVGLKGIRRVKPSAAGESASEEALVPVPAVDPVRTGESRVIVAEDDNEDALVDDDTASKPKRGFFGFGRKKSAETEVAAQEDAGYDPDADPFAPSRDDDETKKA
ncbi:alkaline shock response membrane anchor protein AmaP [Ruficoccus amylovorans]|uniref:Alkaline shock response membrane anchor protein AmaP n=1 Tax=Ruficoccus amylovorans TaxID=1804625 RepID=A0A842HML0_9BACT|nr:alkaline shock response membrane anchor protein AmaP [Ruficoccus amylovorans]MBC2596321.1 alkaline shock response membrane anchor protein AmaP [Ruficoccus amylovorans]